MADLVYDQEKFETQLRRIDQNIKKLESEKETYEQNMEVVRKNWSGDEFNKAEPKLMEIGKTLDKAIEDQKTQKAFLEQKNSQFANQLSGF